MITTVVIALLALIALAYVAIPLLFPSQADPLPDLRDPVTQDLEEEREALFRAIRELELREDLPEERRAQLRARYEAKAAKVLRALDERSGELDGRARPAGPRRFPYGVLSLLLLMVVSAAALSAFVLPRVGRNASVTSFFEEDLETARALRELQREADRTPNEETLMALADAYWQLDDFANAEASYLQVVDTLEPPPALAYRRLGLLSLQRDLDEAIRYFELARDIDPENADTLFTLGEIHFSQGNFQAARDAWLALLATPNGAGDEQIIARLELLEVVTPLAERATQDPNPDNLMALAGALWDGEERERAASVYLQVLNDHDLQQPTALSRIGQLLFFSGRNEDAASLLERSLLASSLGGETPDPETLLILGNAYFGQGRYQEAIDVWQSYVARVGGAENAGRVPDLLASARARLAGELAAGTLEASGEQLFTSICAVCHGVQGQGGTGLVLRGNPRAADPEIVRSTIRFGRGVMPGFSGSLDEEQIAAVTEYVTQVIAPGDAGNAQ